jgi:hypothetical protein
MTNNRNNAPDKLMKMIGDGDYYLDGLWYKFPCYILSFVGGDSAIMLAWLMNEFRLAKGGTIRSSKDRVTSDGYFLVTDERVMKQLWCTNRKKIYRTMQKLIEKGVIEIRIQQIRKGGSRRYVKILSQKIQQLAERKK